MKNQTKTNRQPRAPKNPKPRLVQISQPIALQAGEGDPALVPVYEGKICGRPCQVVVARELHGFLESRQDYSNWIKSRIKKYDFAEKLDFEEFSINLSKTSKGGRPVREYHLTLDMAKELSMVEKTAKASSSLPCPWAGEGRRCLSGPQAPPSSQPASGPAPKAGLFNQIPGSVTARRILRASCCRCPGCRFDLRRVEPRVMGDH